MSELKKFDESFVYVIYGEQERHYLEAQLSIASLIFHNPKAKICVLAERDDLFEAHPQLRVIPFTKSMQKEWLGNDQYHFKLKLAGLKFLLEHHAKKVVFLDTDTLIRADLSHLMDAISNESTLMHELEGTLRRKRFTRQYQAAIGKTFESPTYGSWKVEPDAPMFNSGVIGITEAHLEHLDIALWMMPLLDELIDIHSAEQFALGIILSRHGTVCEAGNRQIYHYWHKKPRKYIFEQMQSLVGELKGGSLYHYPERIGTFQFRRPFKRWLNDKLSGKAPTN
ncbi:hypothetical protein [Pseudoalteromonas luteoviolacea]|uniref:Nucleotide-diphospho-sugar transferase domain-containing protein n=1 Tax=Pseudoalteromonas luteoviolacea S4054 TaxID=1129367 RepID=A0A0F6A4U9_9GAMM|nr:hypothetical protein [Pseudoalteromonas luteoviolacea]AOT10725.1 hypothetical protein S4054249_22990 [Pseudoalteromonas luteoviolacea]AOT16113.1 hypothetical protein S40542_25520 [Pseudoalteromonas luteoviolacea]AOT20545.1 hypothetical protein S4054_22905 [Pseudoalteromonas luteoviolacea]KKE81255.1 hypothetical protein N479_23025 [Pseudoalteromonas luteoviolacea S4054]KZN68982.1 hypothetical protein N481_22835 [Pseudoalteromonas luteoviolacea S4047-1]